MIGSRDQISGKIILFVQKILRKERAMNTIQPDPRAMHPGCGARM